jgi:TonB family protein
VIWTLPLRERTFPRRFWILSALLHAGAFVLVRSESFDLEGRGVPRSLSRHVPRAPAVFAGQVPLEVIELAVAGPEPAHEAEPRARAVEALDVERILSAIGAGVASPAAPTPPSSPSARGDAGAFSPPVPLAFRWPEYPEGAPRGAGPTTVVVRVRVDADGEVERVELEKAAGAEVLNLRALDVARGMRFSPARREGRPVAAWFSLPVTFHP